MPPTLGRCANLNCQFGGIAPFPPHRCPGCSLNIHAPCGTEGDKLSEVWCPTCKPGNNSSSSDDEDNITLAEIAAAAATTTTATATATATA